MAARLELAGHDQLQHFIASIARDDGAAWTMRAHERPTGSSAGQAPSW